MLRMAVGCIRLLGAWQRTYKSILKVRDISPLSLQPAPARLDVG
jgi:hypothetical protein